MADASNPQSPYQLDGKRLLGVVLYTVSLTFILSALLYQTIRNAADNEFRAALKAERDAFVRDSLNLAKSSAVPKTVQAPAAGATTQQAGPAANPAANVTPAIPQGNTPATTTGTPSQEKPVDTNKELPKKETLVQTPVKPTPPTPPGVVMYVLWAITLAGGLGAALSNLRGLYEYHRDLNYFPAYLEMPFYLRPLSGMLCGLFTFFVSNFFAGALAQQSAGAWQTVQGSFPFIGIAFLAGFAAQEFMERLKETAKALFGVTTQTPVVANPAAAQPVATPPAQGTAIRGKLESFDDDPTAPESEPSAMPKMPPPPAIGGRRPD